MNDKAGLLAILDDEFRRHPAATGQDVLKLIVQSIFGGDHLLTDPKRFRKDLLEEWEGISDRGVRPHAIQPISPDGRVARIHLIPCKAAGIDVGELIDALVGQPMKDGRREAFDALWQAVIELAAEGRLPISQDVLRHLSALEGLPHHSSTYGPAAYRILNDMSDPGMAASLKAWELCP